MKSFVATIVDFGYQTCMRKAQLSFIVVSVVFLHVLTVKGQPTPAPSSEATGTSQPQTPTTTPAGTSPGAARQFSSEPTTLEAGPNAQEKATSPGQARSSNGGIDFRKAFTVTASLREEFDDNINTTKRNKQSQFSTNVSPSLLFSLPLDQTLLSARYTFNGRLFADRDGNDFDMSHEFAARLNHSFSSRFSVDVRELFRYTQEASLFSNATLIRRNGTYFENVASIEGTAQWTPKFGTVTSYTSDLIDYNNRFTSASQDRLNHNVGHDFRFLILPKLTFVAGGIYTFNDYDKSFRDSQSITGTLGADYALSPQVTVGGRLGATYTDLMNGGSDYTSPYARLFVNWVLGARSSIDASYTHSIEATDAASFYGQESDNITFGGRYQWTPRFSTRGQLILSYGQYDSQLGVTGTAFDEVVFGFELSAAYKLNNYLDLEAGYTYTSVFSDLNAREYDRNRIYIGIRGTY